MVDQSEDELRKLAERRADAKLAFRAHATTYVVVIAGLAGINYFTSPDYWWFGWAAFGWGLGLLAHGMATYGYATADRERMIAREMERLRAQGPRST